MKEPAPSLEDLRRGFEALSETSAPRLDCPEAGAIWDALRVETSSRDVESVVEHIARCFACAEAWRLGVETAGRPRLPVVSRAPAAGFRMWAGLAAAAVVVLGAGLGVILIMPRGTPPVVMRAGAEAAITSLVPETTPLPRGACHLRWSSPSAQARYTLRVGLEDLSPVAFAQNLDRPEYTIPAKSLEKVPPGAILVWRVEADLPDGRHLASPAFMNRVE